MDAQEAMQNVIDNMTKHIEEKASVKYYRRSQEVTSLIEKSVLETIAKCFEEANNNLFQAVEYIENRRDILLRKASASENKSKEIMYQKGVEIYDIELEKIYTGEI
jgi:hypothetical protein